MIRSFVTRLSLAIAADMVFLAAFGGGFSLLVFAAAIGVWAGAGAEDAE